MTRVTNQGKTSHPIDPRQIAQALLKAKAEKSGVIKDVICGTINLAGKLLYPNSEKFNKEQMKTGRDYVGSGDPTVEALGFLGTRQEARADLTQAYLDLQSRMGVTPSAGKIVRERR